MATLSASEVHDRFILTLSIYLLYYPLRLDNLRMDGGSPFYQTIQD